MKPKIHKRSNLFKVKNSKRVDCYRIFPPGRNRITAISWSLFSWLPSHPSRNSQLVTSKVAEKMRTISKKNQTRMLFLTLRIVHLSYWSNETSAKIMKLDLNWYEGQCELCNIAAISFYEVMKISSSVYYTGPPLSCSWPYFCSKQ